MAFEVETGQGLETANAYASVQDFKDYCSLRAIPLGDKSDDDLQAAIVKATDWIDNNYANSLLGYRSFGQQALEFPRTGLPPGSNGQQRPLGYMPPQLIKATCIVALEALNGALYVNVSGASPQVTEETIGPITTKYNPINPNDVTAQRNFDEARQAMSSLVRNWGLLQVSR